MVPVQPLAMPIPFGISADTAMPLSGIDDSSLDSFSQSDDEDSGLRDYLDLKTGDSGPHRGVVGDIRSPNDLSKTGWGVIFAPSADQQIREALAPLLKHRGIGNAGRDPRLFKSFEGDTGVLRDDSAESWLKRRGVRMDVVRPSLGVPFYLMIVGPPDEISFEFQYALDLYWAVGRIWFPTADEFRQYADSVVHYETMAAADVPTSKQMVVFAPSHDLDPATQAFSRDVARPMAAGSDAVPRAGEAQDFAVQPFIGPAALKDNLERIFTGAIDHGPPALVFSGSHGKAFGPDLPEPQAESQGAIICNDWPGFGCKFTREHYFDASDLANVECRTHGMIHFLFACYGGGWPMMDTFSRRAGTPKMIALRPMLARLPQVLLSHRNGGALAVLAHIDRAWAYSFRDGSNPQIQGFSDVIARVMWGDRLGLATDQFNMRWANLSRGLAERLDKAQSGLMVNPKTLANQWVARDDARNYIVFGDPAVCLRVDDMPVIKQ